MVTTWFKHYLKGNARGINGPCVACGETTHFKSNCLYIRRPAVPAALGPYQTVAPAGRILLQQP
ncbi:hypothetical protein DPMN_078341 [Dreissena polymorpha]|uniref:Uncharacterized protein n=1 Tax=Dreissena polymorpha TaxID=45954 RepID=A0A9D4BQ49_DREPO|nr:hypothetical protein DPMN_078341 [Dreissena polymorpha]